MTSDSTIFLTGFPGFIASRLLGRLALTGARFLLLVQPSLMETAHVEIANLAQQTSRPVSDFRLLTGDITRPDLGLSAPELQQVKAETTHIFHLAALYDLAVEKDLAFRVNVEGTRNVNILARSLSGLRHYHHISTCYVAGKREGRIFETELRHDAGFRNFYEESKYFAELEVESLKGELPITIHRPSVVCGDSTTGEAVKYDGVYYLINYLLRWPRVLSILNIGNQDVSLNLVPVDFVVNALAALAFDERIIGQTLQLADPQPLSTNELFNAIAHAINGNKSRLTIPPSWVRFGLMLRAAPAITRLPHHGVPYFFVRQSYDTTQAQLALAPARIEVPRFESYVSRIVAYAARNGKRK